MRGNVYGRLERLEGRLKPDICVDMTRPPDPDVVAVLDTFSGMRSMMSDRSYRGSPTGLVKIEPRDVAREHYGRDYTEREFLELAVNRALEGLGYEEEELGERMPGLLALFESFDREETGERYT